MALCTNRLQSPFSFRNPLFLRGVQRLGCSHQLSLSGILPATFHGGSRLLWRSGTAEIAAGPSHGCERETTALPANVKWEEGKQRAGDTRHLTSKHRSGYGLEELKSRVFITHSKVFFFKISLLNYIWKLILSGAVWLPHESATGGQTVPGTGQRLISVGSCQRLGNMEYLHNKLCLFHPWRTPQLCGKECMHYCTVHLSVKCTACAGNVSPLPWCISTQTHPSMQQASCLWSSPSQSDIPLS